MIRGDLFFVIQCFDREGYYSSCYAHSLREVLRLASARTNKAFVAMSLPFEGRWSPQGVPDVSLPPDFKEALATVDRGATEES